MRPDFFKLKLDFIADLITSVSQSPVFGVEVGVYEGQLSKKLFERLPNMKLTGVDPYPVWQEVAPDADEAQVTDGVYHKQWYTDAAEAEKIYQRALAIFESHQARLFRKTSLEALELFDDASLDFVYLDGNHAYDFVNADIKGWLKKIRPGGLIMGDDFNWRGNLENVGKAVVENFQFDYGVANDVWFHEK